MLATAGPEHTSYNLASFYPSNNKIEDKEFQYFEFLSSPLKIVKKKSIEKIEVEDEERELTFLFTVQLNTFLAVCK